MSVVHELAFRFGHNKACYYCNAFLVGLSVVICVWST